MPRRDLPFRSDPDRHLSQSSSTVVRRRVVDFDIQQELAQLQEIVYESFHIPLTQWTVIDEGKVLDRLEAIGESMPEAIRKALAIIEQEEVILSEAEAYAQRILQSAQQRAAEILDETGIVQQAERQGNQMLYQVQQECEALKRKTLAEVEQLHQTVTQELQQFRQQTLAECRDIQQGADEYASSLLTHLEQQLSEMLRVVRNGRQQLHENSPNRNASGKKASNPPPAKR